MLKPAIGRGAKFSMVEEVREARGVSKMRGGTMRGHRMCGARSVLRLARGGLCYVLPLCAIFSELIWVVLGEGMRALLVAISVVFGCAGSGASQAKLDSPVRPESRDSVASGTTWTPVGDSGERAEEQDVLEVTSFGIACESPSSSLSYQDIAVDWGLVDTSDGNPRRKEAGPVAAMDLDGDGLDELLVGHRGLGLVLHRNQGASFAQSTVLPVSDLTGIALGDVDGDGDLDVWTGGYAAQMWLLRNDGPAGDGWQFTDVSAESGLNAVPVLPQKTDAAFSDVDGDGALDILVTRAAGPGASEEAVLNQLWLGQGDGTFVLASSSLPEGSRGGVSWSPVWSDLDGDGDVDVFVANADQATAGPSVLLENQSDGGSVRWVDHSDTCFCTENGNPMGVSAADYDHDGDFDLFLTNTASDQLLRNEGGLVFVDESRVHGAMALPSSRHMTFGSVWVDVDNDGWQDLFVSSGPLSEGPDTVLDVQADRLLHNDGGVAWRDIAASAGVASTGIGRGVTRALLVDDGYPALVVVNLDGPSKVWRAACMADRSLVVALRQASGNTRGIGAQVSLTMADGTVQVQEVSTKAGWGGAMEPRAWFGLGGQAPRTLSVRWPDGVREEWPLPESAHGRVLLVR